MGQPLASLLSPGSNALASGLGLPTTILSKWSYVEQRLTKLLVNIQITEAQVKNGATSQAGVRACQNRNYWGMASESANSQLIGSWAKLTRVRPSSDIDMIFLLPPAVYWRYQHRAGNRQSQLLQEVKTVLAATYSRTAFRGDRQVVVVPFDSIQIEVAPGFRCQDGSIIVCDAKGDGRYITSTAEAEAQDLAVADAVYGGKVRVLIRLIKLWKRTCNVPLKSFMIERLAVEFLRGWSNAHRDTIWYDWMVRDFMAYLVSRANGWIIMPGTGEIVWLGSDWLSRAQIAHRHATIACIYEEQNWDAAADEAWRQIFGAMPR